MKKIRPKPRKPPIAPVTPLKGRAPRRGRTYIFGNRWHLSMMDSTRTTWGSTTSAESTRPPSPLRRPGPIRPTKLPKPVRYNYRRVLQSLDTIAEDNILLPCKHDYCTTCIEEWIETTPTAGQLPCIPGSDPNEKPFNNHDAIKLNLAEWGQPPASG